MFDHVSIGVRDLARAKRFYDAALRPLGYVCLSENADALGYGRDKIGLWIGTAARPVPSDMRWRCRAAPTSRLQPHPARCEAPNPGSGWSSSPPPPSQGSILALSRLQLCAIGYFVKISSTRLKAFAAAACGSIPSIMMSVQPVLQTCSFSHRSHVATTEESRKHSRRCHPGFGLCVFSHFIRWLKDIAQAMSFIQG